MNPSQEQNRQEALLALEQLSELVGQRGFHHHLNRIQELLKSLKLVEPELSEVNAQLASLQTRHHSWQSEQSTALRTQVEEKITAAKELFGQQGKWEEQQANFQKAYDVLEELHLQLEFERQSLTREDRDACWDTLKATRKELRETRNQASDQIEVQAEAWYQEAKNAVETFRFREAKDTFQALQRDVNQLPLRREHRQQWRDKFNALWEQLQANGKAQREAAQQRQVDGRRKLEEALLKVESFITRKEQDLQVSEARMSDAHWHEVDPIEKQVQRDKQALVDARRRQSELKAKLDDNRSRKRGPQAAVPEAAAPEAANSDSAEAGSEAAVVDEAASSEPEAVSQAAE